VPISVRNADDNLPPGKERLTASRKQSWNGQGSHIVDGFAQADGADPLAENWEILYCADVPFGITVFGLFCYLHDLFGNVNTNEMTIPAT
jgi:hypothetical protein